MASVEAWVVLAIAERASDPSTSNLRHVFPYSSCVWQVLIPIQIPYFTTSGINVRYLKIIEPKVRHGSHEDTEHPLTQFAAAISFFAMGSLHYTIRRHCRPSTRHAIMMTTIIMKTPFHLTHVIFIIVISEFLRADLCTESRMSQPEREYASKFPVILWA